MTTKKQIKIVNCETGEETLRDLTSEEIANYETQAQAKALREVEAEAKAAAKTAAQAKLATLGLTVEDLQALGL
jgi:hypothetical protein